MSGQPYAGDILEPYYGGDATDREPIYVGWIATPKSAELARAAMQDREDDADVKDAMRYFQRQ